MICGELYDCNAILFHFRQGKHVDHKLKIGRQKLSLQVNKEELPTSHGSCMI